MEKDKIIPKSKFDGLEEASKGFESFDVHEFIEEPSDLVYFNEGDLTEDKLYKKYHLKRSSYIPLDEKHLMTFEQFKIH